VSTAKNATSSPAITQPSTPTNTPALIGYSNQGPDRSCRNIFLICQGNKRGSLGNNHFHNTVQAPESASS
ncbi:MAG: hypothetical protein IIY54_03945, partial [Ruminococcus sp.]|nr:hypothetical protein [Ruminococcus sp.]